MQLESWWVLLAPASLLAVGLTPANAANRAPRRMATLSVAAGILALMVAIVADVAAAANGSFSTAIIGIDGVGFSLMIDALSASMLTLVAFVGLVVVRYSRNYLDGDPNQGVFFKRLNLTLAPVLTFVVAGNFALLILAWIATSAGLHSLLLFYPERPGAQLAAKKKFLVSRVGDVCLIAAAAALWMRFGTLSIPDLLAHARAAAPADTAGLWNAAAFLIVIAALLKSAQLPFHGWLLEVMETPTPVSALLHAGVINAGGFLILRFAGIVAPSEGALQLLTLWAARQRSLAPALCSRRRP